MHVDVFLKSENKLVLSNFLATLTSLFLQERHAQLQNNCFIKSYTLEFLRPV